ncbi:exo-alpha-sialidase [Microbispora sp. NEAU-D428]|uniref:F510_1955 family glycosylhydrolase n=1 Tax=Microbispora sitophila TaxID=2771537 RepID=UPI001866FC88|nr:sialidase family protein [Microbispora sitophila]MBE3013482.1 exo-alpha-sialidase [Microbispora sitophila]
MLSTRRRLLGIVALLALLVTGCQADHIDRPQSQRSESMDPGIGHIHGLGVDPADGTIYVAGHFGLFQVRATDSAVRVADRVQDYMGFTVVGPNTFLASGHPSLADDAAGAPARLGLIRTTDAGRTWTTVSEVGTADFHALQPTGASLYAYDSQCGRIRSSTDNGATWTDGAQLQVADLAGSADQPDRLYATTPEGPLVSEDGGKTFTTLVGSPTFTFLDALGEGLVIGIATDETVRVSQDDGKTWKTQGTVPGPAVAFATSDGRRLLVATEDGTVYQSKDSGRTFSEAYRPFRA